MMVITNRHIAQVVLGSRWPKAGGDALWVIPLNPPEQSHGDRRRVEPTVWHVWSDEGVSITVQG